MSSGDQLMTVTGVGLAAAITAFACIAIAQNDGSPAVHGSEHLALFAKPSRARDDRVASSGSGPSERVVVVGGELRTQSVDYAPTATIGKPAATGPQLRRVLRDRVVVLGTTGSFELRPGEAAVGLGRLQEIRSEDGRLTAVFAPDGKAAQSSR